MVERAGGRGGGGWAEGEAKVEALGGVVDVDWEAPGGWERAAVGAGGLAVAVKGSTQHRGPHQTRLVAAWRARLHQGRRRLEEARSDCDVAGARAQMAMPMPAQLPLPVPLS